MTRDGERRTALTEWGSKKHPQEWGKTQRQPMPPPPPLATLPNLPPQPSPLPSPPPPSVTALGAESQVGDPKDQTRRDGDAHRGTAGNDNCQDYFAYMQSKRCQNVPVHLAPTATEFSSCQPTLAPVAPESSTTNLGHQSLPTNWASPPSERRGESDASPRPPHYPTSCSPPYCPSNHQTCIVQLQCTE